MGRAEMVVLSVRGPSLFPLSFFALRNFEFPAKIKKGGGKTHRTPYLLRPWRSDIPPPFPVGSWETLAEESLQTKEKAEKSIFIYGTSFGKGNLFRDFQRVQIYSIAHKNQKRITAGNHSKLGSPHSTTSQKRRSTHLRIRSYVGT